MSGTGLAPEPGWAGRGKVRGRLAGGPTFIFALPIAGFPRVQLLLKSPGLGTKDRVIVFLVTEGKTDDLGSGFSSLILGSGISNHSGTSN